jgi:hypothetical protein
MTAATIQTDRQPLPVIEARVVRASAPTCYLLHGLRRWRWQATTYRPTDSAHPGVWDSRLHLGDDHGHTFTRLGALVALGRALRNSH